MSLQVPLIGVASKYVSRLGHLPSSTETKKLLNTDNIDAVLIMIRDSFGIADISLDNVIEKLNNYSPTQIEEILSLLPDNSAPFVYLTLAQDFEKLKTLALSKTIYGEALGDKAFEQILAETTTHLHYASQFKSKLLAKEEKLIHSHDSFSLISYLEEIFLTLLFENLSKSSDIMRDFVLAKIDSYTLLNVLTRTQKGQSKEHILRHLLPIQGSLAINAVKSFSFGDILGDIGQYLNLAPVDINIINIENTLIQNEIKTLHRAQFTGMSGDRIIQYTERLQYSISNFKLLILQNSKQIDSKQAKLRFIDYSNIC
jgi:hypothetical protein